MNNNTNTNQNNKGINQVVNVTRLMYKPTISIADVNVKDIVECVNTTLKPIIPGYISASASVHESKGITFKILISGKSPMLERSFLSDLPMNVKDAVKLTPELRTKLKLYCDDKIEYVLFNGNGGKSTCIITLNAGKVIENTFPKPEEGYAYKLKIVNPSNRKRKYFGKIRLIKARLDLLEQAEEELKDC